MRLKVFDNRDPRWTDDELAAIDAKVEQAMALPARLGLSYDEGVMTEKERHWMLTYSFREIVKATSLETLLAAPPALLEQFSVLAITRDHNIRALLLVLLRNFMTAYADPSTNKAATGHLEELDRLAQAAIDAQPAPEQFQWVLFPGIDCESAPGLH